jgi:hypothetical protein
MFQFPGLAFVTYLFSHKYLLMILQFQALQPRSPCGNQSKKLGVTESKVGFPIRKFLDQSPFAAPQNLSQRTTSFIASQRQGIHQIPLRHLIALIINAHPSAEAAASVHSRTTRRSLGRPVSKRRLVQSPCPSRRRTRQPDQSTDPSPHGSQRPKPSRSCGL